MNGSSTGGDTSGSLLFSRITEEEVGIETTLVVASGSGKDGYEQAYEDLQQAIRVALFSGRNIQFAEAVNRTAQALKRFFRMVGDSPSVPSVDTKLAYGAYWKQLMFHFNNERYGYDPAVPYEERLGRCLLLPCGGKLELTTSGREWTLRTSCELPEYAKAAAEKWAHTHKFSDDKERYGDKFFDTYIEVQCILLTNFTRIHLGLTLLQEIPKSCGPHNLSTGEFVSPGNDVVGILDGKVAMRL